MIKRALSEQTLRQTEDTKQGTTALGCEPNKRQGLLPTNASGDLPPPHYETEPRSPWETLGFPAESPSDGAKSKSVDGMDESSAKGMTNLGAVTTSIPI